MLHFSTNGWTSPNHHAYIAFNIEHIQNVKPISILLDFVGLDSVPNSVSIFESLVLICMSQSHPEKNLADAFTAILHNINKKVSLCLHMYTGKVLDLMFSCDRGKQPMMNTIMITHMD
jgi:hypothetical protein